MRELSVLCWIIGYRCSMYKQKTGLKKTNAFNISIIVEFNETYNTRYVATEF